MLLVVGLGNPGKEYENTNHNAGFRVLDILAKDFDQKFGKRVDCDSIVCKFKCAGEDIILAKPQTYMNNSGLSVKGLVKKYKIDVKNKLVIIADDFDIKEGSVRIRQSSGASTHNGIKSIKAELNTNEFIRVKVSIGAKPAFLDTATFVLDRVKNDKTFEAEKLAALSVKDFIMGEDIQLVMGKYSS